MNTKLKLLSLIGAVMAGTLDDRASRPFRDCPKCNARGAMVALNLGDGHFAHICPYCHYSEMPTDK